MNIIRSFCSNMGEYADTPIKVTHAVYIGNTLLLSTDIIDWDEDNMTFAIFRGNSFAEGYLRDTNHVGSWANVLSRTWSHHYECHKKCR